MKKLLAAMGFIAIMVIGYLTLNRPQATTVVAVSHEPSATMTLDSKLAQTSTEKDEQHLSTQKPIEKIFNGTDSQTTLTKEQLAELKEKYARMAQDTVENYKAKGFEADKKGDYVNLSIEDLAQLHDSGDIYAIAELANRAYKSGNYRLAYQLRKENIGLGSIASAINQFLDMSDFLRKYQQEKIPTHIFKQAANLGENDSNYLNNYKLRMYASTLSAGYLSSTANKTISARVFRDLDREGPQSEEFFLNNLNTIVQLIKTEHNNFNTSRQQRGMDLLEVDANHITVESIKHAMERRKKINAKYSQHDSSLSVN